MKKNLKRDLQSWLKHWYLGGGADYNREILTPDSKRMEKIAYEYIRDILSNDEIISPNASPLSLPKSIRGAKKMTSPRRRD
jgi:hypothetical protein